MSTAIVTIVVDVALETSWWIIRKTTYGVYYGISYLFWGSVDSQDEKQRKQLIEQMKTHNKLLAEMKLMIANGKCDYEGADLPPSYQDIDNEDSVPSSDFNVVETL